MTTTSCDRYWREGVLLVEQGVADVHRETCEACQEAHASREVIVRALPLTGGEGRADWQQRVWQAIARDEAERRAPSRRPWVIGGLALAAAVIAIVVLVPREQAPERYVTAVTIEKGPVVKRGGAQVGDRVRTLLDPADEVRIYRRNELVFRCGPSTVGAACTRDERGRVAVYELPTAGDYTIVIITKSAVEPRGGLDADLAALVDANVTYRIEHELAVR